MDLKLILCIILLPISIGLGYWRTRDAMLFNRFGPAFCSGLYANSFTRFVIWLLSTALTISVVFLLLTSLGLDLEQTFTKFLFGVIIFFRIAISTGLASKSLQKTYSYETMFEGKPFEEKDR